MSIRILVHIGVVFEIAASMISDISKAPTPSITPSLTVLNPVKVPNLVEVSNPVLNSVKALNTVRTKPNVESNSSSPET